MVVGAGVGGCVSKRGLPRWLLDVSKMALGAGQNRGQNWSEPVRWPKLTLELWAICDQVEAKMAKKVGRWPFLKSVLAISGRCCVLGHVGTFGQKTVLLGGFWAMCGRLSKSRGQN